MCEIAFMKLIPLICLLFISLSLTFCHNNADIDVSKIKINYKAIRFDSAFYAIDTNNLKASTLQLEQKHPDFMTLYTQQLQGWGSLLDSSGKTWNAIHHFLTYKDYRGLNDSIQKHYPNTKELDKELALLLKHYIYYYPTAKTPAIYYFNSGLNNWGCITYEDILIGIGLDMYLGEQYPFYASVQIPQYKFHQLTQQHIAVDVARNIYRNKFPFTPDGKKLLELMIEKGKEQYFIQRLLPQKAMHIQLGYIKDQLDWCTKNEYMIYSFFITNKLLYNGDLQQVFRFVTDGPNTMSMPEQSPGNIGSWLGLRMVNAYMKNNPDVSLEKLLSTTISAEQFLQKSGYKP